MDTSEIVCTDPNCAPVDTVVRLLFKGNVGCVFRLPWEAAEVTKEILDENMPPEEYIEGWIQGRNDLEWPPRHDPVLVEGEGPPKDVELRFGVNTVRCLSGRRRRMGGGNYHRVVVSTPDVGTERLRAVSDSIGRLRR